MTSINWPTAFAIVGCAYAFAVLCVGVVFGMREEWQTTTTYYDKPESSEGK